MENKHQTIKSILDEEKIEYFCILPAEKAKIINPRLLPLEVKSVIVFLVPYKTSEKLSCSMAHFSVIKDYHGFSKELFSRIIPKLEKAFEGSLFYGFADHSPVDERLLAEEGGLGDIGKNGLLLNEKYGSYVFIGEIFTTTFLDEYKLYHKKLCNECNKCLIVCPKQDECLSAISQKKNKTENDFAILKETKTIWGCDKCAEVCPANDNASLSPFEYFYEEAISSPKDILEMSEEQFKKYAFSFRPRFVIEENIKNVLTKK